MGNMSVDLCGVRNRSPTIFIAKVLAATGTPKNASTLYCNACYQIITQGKSATLK